MPQARHFLTCMRRRGNAGQLLGALPVAAGDADVESDDRETGEEEHW